MKISLIIQNSENGAVFDATNLAGEITVESELGDVPSKMIFALQQDPNEVMQLSNGSTVAFRVNERGFFWGNIFTIGTDGTGIYQMTAYGRKRYMKNQDTYVTRDLTASAAFAKICGDNGLPFAVFAASSYVPPPKIHDTKTYYEICDYFIQLSNTNEGKQYIIRDTYDAVEFTELEQLKTNTVIGDKSLLTNYQYEASIDADTYNRIKIVRDNKETKKRDVWIEEDGNNQKRWGRLQYFKKVDEKMNEGQIKEFAANLLKVKNRITKTMRLTAIGNTELQAGNGFNCKLDRLGIDEFMWITSATHSFQNDYHVMELEVFI